MNMGGCGPKQWTKAPVRVSALGDPSALLVGKVRDDIDHLVIRYDDGSEQRIRRDRLGYVLAAVPESQRTAGRKLVEIQGAATDGSNIDRQPLSRG